jgi:tetratricopeptide (TPR) repeat protein
MSGVPGRKRSADKEADMTTAWPGTVRVLAGIVTICAVIAPAAVGTAEAAGGGGDNTSPAPMMAPSKPLDPDYEAAVKAIKASQYRAAIPLLENVVQRDSKNADAYNWLGYATRKNGDAAASIPLYEKALAIDPKHRGAHEYIGEAYLMMGDLPKAKEHLARLDKLCFFSCEEYRDLKKAVQQYEKTKAGR